MLGRMYVDKKSAGNARLVSLACWLCVFWCIAVVGTGCGVIEEPPPGKTWTPQEPPVTPRTTPPTPRTTPNPDGTISWKRELAAAALERGAKSWHENSSARRADGKTACLSCHTTFTYVVARTIVRERFKLAKTTLETQLFQDISTRVSKGDDARVWYGSSPAKVKQSQGSEAVVNAMSLATRDAMAQRATPQAITLQALDQLWKHQIKEGAQAGAWAWLDFGLGPWEDQAAAYWGAAMAAIAVGSAPGYTKSAPDPQRYPNSQDLPTKLKRLRGYLMKPYHDKTISLYDEIMLLWASTKLSGLLNEDQRQASAAKILRAQREDGGWALLMMGSWKPSDERQIKSDAYATGLVIYVLRQQGLLATETPLRSGLVWLRDNQRPEGHWTAPSINRSRRGEVTTFMTDAATAYAMMALAAQ